MVDANVLVSELLRVRGRGLIGDSALDLRVSEETLDEALHEMTKRTMRRTRRTSGRALLGSLVRRFSRSNRLLGGAR